MQIASFIDHTILKPTTTLAEIETLCKEAVEYNFAAVCVPPPFTRLSKTILSATGIKVATVIGFPFGYAGIESKQAETVLALVDGADEIDMVINLIALRRNDWSYLEKEVRLLTGICHQKNKLIKVIIESGVLTNEEIITCCKIFGALEIDFMKTSTGYAEKGASVEAVQLMRKHLPSHTRIKASGGIRTFKFAKQLIDAGANRLGCSASVAIVREQSELGADS
jgi:deoxyribose-phosphate aldolase